MSVDPADRVRAALQALAEIFDVLPSDAKWRRASEYLEKWRGEEHAEGFHRGQDFEKNRDAFTGCGREPEECEFQRYEEYEEAIEKHRETCADCRDAHETHEAFMHAVERDD